MIKFGNDDSIIYFKSIIDFCITTKSLDKFIAKLYFLINMENKDIILYKDKYPNLYFNIESNNNLLCNGELIYYDTNNKWEINT